MAFGASLCCTGPLIALAVGSTSLGMFAFLEPIRPYVSLLALGVLGWGYFRLYRKSGDKECCDLDREDEMIQKKRQKRILLGITPIVIALLLFPYYGYSLLANEDDAQREDGVSEIWRVEGMTCSGCAVGLEKGMNAVEGIINCSVDYDTKTMVCSYNEQTLSSNEIESFVKKMGYQAIPREGKDEDGES